MVLLAARISHLVPRTAEALVGDFISPRAYQQLGHTAVWAADNDAFSGFNPDRFRRMLDTILTGVIRRRGMRPPAFITVPDVVGKHLETFELWQTWHREVGGRGLNTAFVLQNGIEDELDRNGFNCLPWEELDALFIGGDTAFKFSPEVRELVHYAKDHGKWVHMGRVNSVKRMLYAKRIGCDSCDGSGMARFPTSVLLPMVRALQSELASETHQLTLL